MILRPEDLAFRDEVRAFLDEHLSEAMRTAGRRCSGIFTDYEDNIVWHRLLARKGWIVPHWPVEHGGTGWTPLQHHLFASEMAAADAPPLSPLGVGMVGPVLIAYGTPEQQARWLPGIRSGDDYWCQGYSEPGSGSDLASLKTRAVRDGDHYIINGTKIWTTHAHRANRMFCLVRTSTEGKPQQGISFLCFDLRDVPGITIRPIISISGDHELNQVFFDDVRVPATGLIGEENQGWTIAKYLLQHERGGSYAPRLQARLNRLRAAAREAFEGTTGARDEAEDLRMKLAEAQCRIDALHALELRALAARQRGEPAGIRPSMGKLLGTELKQFLTEIGVEIAAHYGHVRLPMAEADAAGIPESSVFAMSAYLNDRAASIYGGTNEVQRNIIATQLLAR